MTELNGYGPILDEIDEFGRIDAESELQLADFFIRTDAYMRIEDREHIVVIGRKGTGKTAIYKAVLQRSTRFTNTHAVGLQFRNYPWQAHAEVEDPQVAQIERYTESWHFLILVELAQLVLLSPRLIPKTPQADAARKLYQISSGRTGAVCSTSSRTPLQRRGTHSHLSLVCRRSDRLDEDRQG